jgi:hypothetical protein
MCQDSRADVATSFRFSQAQEAADFAVEFLDLARFAYQVIWHFNYVMFVLRHWARRGLDGLAVADLDGIGLERTDQCSSIVDEYK